MAIVDSRDRLHAWRSSKFFIVPVLTFAIFVGELAGHIIFPNHAVTRDAH
jgi:branched-subunit amino acid permease